MRRSYRAIRESAQDKLESKSKPVINTPHLSPPPSITEQPSIDSLTGALQQRLNIMEYPHPHRSPSIELPLAQTSSSTSTSSSSSLSQQRLDTERSVGNNSLESPHSQTSSTLQMQQSSTTSHPQNSTFTDSPPLFRTSSQQGSTIERTTTQSTESVLPRISQQSSTLSQQSRGNSFLTVEQPEQHRNPSMESLATVESSPLPTSSNTPILLPPSASSMMATTEEEQGQALEDYSDFTELDLLAARLEDERYAQDGTMYNQLNMLAEFLGDARPKPAITEEEMDSSLAIVRVELVRRRVDKNGKVKQKLSCAGVSVNKCPVSVLFFFI